MSFQTRPSLIARLRDTADVAAWGEFVTHYDPFIRRVSSAAGVPRHAVMDIVQEVLLTVVRTIPRFQYDPARGRFRAWLARVVRSRSVDWTRRERRETSTRPAVDQSSAKEGDIVETAESSHEAAVRQGLMAVRASSRLLTWQCFERHVLDGQPAADVAQELGLSENAVFLNSMRLTRRVETESRRALERSVGHVRQPLSSRS